jgi:hypothetical protein
MRRDSSADVDGVLAVDFELASLSNFLHDALAGTISWAYLVEVESGKLLATSFGAPMEDHSGERCFATGDVIDSSGARTRVFQSDSIYASAVKLSAEGWRETEDGEILTNTVSGNRTQGQAFEAVARRIDTLDNLQWLLVVGQDIDCASNERWLLGQCDDCPEGQVPSDDRTCIVCGQEFPGTVSDDALAAGLGVECVCPVGSYSVRQPGAPNTCQPCSSLSDSTVGALDKTIDNVPWDQPSVCPGGVTTETKICPLNEVWIEIEEPAEDLNEYTRTRVNLLRCPACVSTPCANVSSFGLTDVSHIAVCKNHHEGFICAECEPGYKAIQGECVECSKVDYKWMVIEVLTAALIGFVLLSKTWHSVCKPDDAPAVFNAMDVSEDGFLEAAEVRALLIRMGNPIAASKMFNQTLSDMKGKNLYRGVKLSKQRSWLPKKCGGLDPPPEEVVEQLHLSSISMQEFIDWCRANQNKAIVSTFTFGIQTFGLIAAETSDFSLAELFNLDVNAAAKTCRMPNCGLFCGMMGMALMPLVGGITIYVGIWFLSTQVSMVWEERKAQTAVSVIRFRGLPMAWHHLQQGLMQVFLFSFAPITRRCASLLMCRTVPNGPGSVTTRLVSDLSLECWTGSHMIAAVLAVILLILFAVVAPIVLLHFTRERVQKKPGQLNQTCGERDSQEGHSPQPSSKDGSMRQENEERKIHKGAPSLLKPASFLSTDYLDDEVREGIGLTCPDQRARLTAVPKLNPKAWDVLTMATRDKKYWWCGPLLTASSLCALSQKVSQRCSRARRFIAILMYVSISVDSQPCVSILTRSAVCVGRRLKLLVNGIFLVGKALECMYSKCLMCLFKLLHITLSCNCADNWAMWLQITLMTAAFLSHYHHPYVLVSDNHQEQMTFLGLALTLSITNSGITYSGTWRWFHVLVVLAVVIIITAYFAKIQYETYQAKKRRTKRVRNGEKNLKQFTREVFSAAVPTFLLLPDEDRHAIRILLQVETFQKGDVLYHQGDDARAFYLIKEGQITLRSSLHDSTRTLGVKQAVGAGALLFEPQRRTATAVASSVELVCLRMIRTDWIKHWAPITQKAARQLFEKLDKNDSGGIDAKELKSMLQERWTKSSKEEAEKNVGSESTPFDEELLNATVDRLIKLMDTDCSGSISLDE